jgi:hypothetical protein
MKHKKMHSNALIKLSDRIIGLKSIHPNLVLKNGLSVKGGEQLKTALEEALTKCNLTLSAHLTARYELDLLEKETALYSKNSLMGVSIDYGDDSLEYEKVGGTRMSLRKRKKKIDKTV